MKLAVHHRLHFSSSRLALGVAVLIAGVFTSASTPYVVQPVDAAITSVVTQALAVEQTGIVRPSGHGPIAASSIQTMQSSVASKLGQMLQSVGLIV